MNRNQRIALAEKDFQVKDLAISLNMHANHITSVLSGRSKSPELRKKICELLGKPESYLWPDKEQTKR